MSRSVTLKGNPFKLEGPELKAGEKAPDATVKTNLLESSKLSALGGGVRVLSVVPSLDTSVCAAQTKRFNEEAGKLPNVKIFTVSADLPVAQTRFCGAEGIDPSRVKMLSDHKDHAFGSAYGTWMPDVGIHCRAVFVVDGANTIRYAEYVPEIASHPNYNKILETCRQLK